MKLKRLLITPRIEYIDNSWKYFVNESYLKALAPYELLLECPLSFHHIDILSEAYDALLVTGGYDIAPHYFNCTLHEQAHLYDRPLDHYDLSFIDAFVRKKKPILGICRGMQLLNVYFNGTLCQHFETALHEEKPHFHHVSPLNNTIFTKLLGSNTWINSYHHQCIDTLGDKLQIGAAASDQRIEAIFHSALPILGVQWHPELLDNDQIIPYFIDQLVYKGATSLFPSETAATPK